jgi:hypothetical protein
MFTLPAYVHFAYLRVCLYYLHSQYLRERRMISLYIVDQHMFSVRQLQQWDAAPRKATLLCIVHMAVVLDLVYQSESFLKSHFNSRTVLQTVCHTASHCCFRRLPYSNSRCNLVNYFSKSVGARSLYLGIYLQCSFWLWNA